MGIMLLPIFHCAMSCCLTCVTQSVCDKRVDKKEPDSINELIAQVFCLHPQWGTDFGPLGESRSTDGLEDTFRT
ncbi:hypothetical protein BDM02DRAFT_3107269 [Thelephora ganbajun]|uniref:Uncharacterized protein n=1 Tax=Thelephora ganbajun TaxID=370292 RepID=A0ACB6ZX30_THEGA|nr:hypothetical protein BDM02DRAFT_3107269 [Thelephora ganbajun]